MWNLSILGLYLVFWFKRMRWYEVRKISFIRKWNDLRTINVTAKKSGKIHQQEKLRTILVFTLVALRYISKVYLFST